MIERDEEELDEGDELDELSEPVTVADAVAFISTLRTMLASMDGILRVAIRDLVGEDEEIHDP